MALPQLHSQSLLPPGPSQQLTSASRCQGGSRHQATKVLQEAWARADTPTQPRRGDASSTLAVSSPPSPSGSIRGWRGLDSSGDVARGRVVGSRYEAPAACSPADRMPRHSWAASPHSSPRTFEFDAGAGTGTGGSPCRRACDAGGFRSPAREVLRSGSPDATRSLAARQRRDQASRDTQQRGPGPGVAPSRPDTGSSPPGKAAQAGVRQTSPALRAEGAEPTARVQDQVHRQLQQAQAEVEVLVAERSLIILTSQAKLAAAAEENSGLQQRLSEQQVK
ncbi:hypothetical protein HaLaN_28685 [Haematococcus lacustris]|uniref:Uncharacterized protein n=1 Tax=Haematococcus lacustris TaxID=44745 RepID=A0A6A0ACY4_HAELA|nr:hypothetical protein HaLaN_28685 [Haematococcus lacustris]